MKKLLFVIVIFAVMAASTQLFAQNSEILPDVHYINVTVERILPTRYGYIVIYSSGSGRVHRLLIPHEFFRDNRADRINLPRGGGWPSLSVFFKDGEFSHARLHVHRSRAHSTWGNPPIHNPALTQAFQGVETITLEF